MKKIIFIPALILSVLFLACQNKNQQSGTEMNDTTMNKDTSKIAQDTSFLDEAAQGGMMMVQIGKMAQQKSHLKEIKDFGNMMVTDHSKVDDELKNLAMQNDILLPDLLNRDKQDKD